MIYNRIGSAGTYQMRPNSGSRMQTTGNRRCTFCKDIEGNESIQYSHHVSECPYLKINICNNCFYRGHTAGYCPNKTRFSGMMNLATVANRELARNPEMDIETKLKHETTIMKFLGETDYRLNMMRILKGALKGNCKFCLNSQQYDPYNFWHNNHQICNCPRLALVVCKNCKQKGHCDKVCPKNIDKSVDMGPADLSNFNFVFTSLPKPKPSEPSSPELELSDSEENSDEEDNKKRGPRLMTQSANAFTNAYHDASQFILDFDQLDENPEENPKKKPKTFEEYMANLSI